MRKGNMRHLSIIAIVLMMISTACSGERLNDGIEVVEVSMTEFSFAPNIVEVEAGETVKFVVINDGSIDHDFEIVTQHAIDEHIQGGHEGHNDDGKAEEKEKLKLELKPGETGELTVTFDETQELFFACLIPGHYEAGMVGEFDFSDDAVHDDHQEKVTHDEREDEVTHDEHEDEVTHDEREDETDHNEGDEDDHGEELDDHDDSEEEHGHEDEGHDS